MNADEGGTLFQLNQEIKNANDLDFDQEEEEREDQRRRNNEIANNLNRYLLADDDPTENQLNDSLCDDSGDELRQCGNIIDRLEHELALKNTEIERLKGQLGVEGGDKDKQVHELQKRIDLALAERDRAVLTRNQTHELLIESKSQITELESREQELKKILDKAHNENKDLRIELQQARTMVSDWQYKYNLLEKDYDKRHQLSANNSLQEMREKYNAQINLLQQQIDCLTGKLEAKEETLRTTESQLQQLERSQDMLRVLQTGGSVNQFLEKLKSFEKELMNASEMSHCSKIYQHFSDLLQETLNLTKSPGHSPRLSHSALSPFPYTPGRGFNSTENTKHHSGDGPDTHGFNGLTRDYENLAIEEHTKYVELENEYKTKLAEIEKLKLELEKSKQLLDKANTNFESLKSSYITLSCEKDTAVREYELLKNTEVHRKLKLEQDKVFCLQRDLELTNEKLRVQCGMNMKNRQDRAVSPVKPLLDQYIKDNFLNKADTTMRRFESEVDETIKKFKESESKYIRAIETLQNQLTDLDRRLKIRCQEVESLKAAILFERNEAKALIEQNTAEINKLKEDNEVLKEQEVKALKNLDKVRTESDKKVQVLTEKLLRCHKYTDAYKKYIYEKEMHYIKETDRIREKYHENLGKIREKFDELMKNSRKRSKKIKDVEKPEPNSA